MATGVPPSRGVTSTGSVARPTSPRTVTPKAESSGSYTDTRTWESWLPAMATTAVPSRLSWARALLNSSTASEGGMARS